ncbi:MAG: hypothetical protein D6723_06845 [Acidobacteria bacterium]|nr:MAG: hypothetical protein D6723_06845 [Acidobacteriota bacterium]
MSKEKLIRELISRGYEEFAPEAAENFIDLFESPEDALLYLKWMDLTPEKREKFLKEEVPRAKNPELLRRRIMMSTPDVVP